MTDAELIEAIRRGDRAAFGALASDLAARWRIGAAVLATVTAAVGLSLAIDRSQEVAAHAERSRDVQPSSAQPALARTPPRLPASRSTSERVYRNIVIASPDPAEGCARAARGLVYGLLARDDWYRDGDSVYFTPSPRVERDAEAIALEVSATCEGEPWPSLYVECEGTLSDLIDGNLACYPYDAGA
jgi:hypothetical protein